MKFELYYYICLGSLDRSCFYLQLFLCCRRLYSGVDVFQHSNIPTFQHSNSDNQNKELTLFLFSCSFLVLLSWDVDVPDLHYTLLLSAGTHLTL